jgi:hypothetical protein
MRASLGDSFNPGEVLIAFGAAAVIQTAFVIVLVIAGRTTGEIKAKQDLLPPEVPIAVQPVMDELPLLKLGGKKRPKLPDMWKKQAPIPVENLADETSAPSDKAKDDPDEIPKSPLATADAQAPATDAEVAQQVDTDASSTSDAESPVAGEGHKDGVKEGTEADPLKAAAFSQYRSKLIGWFNSKFQQPSEIPCEELKKLNSSVSASVSPDGTVTGFSVGKASGNGVFDAKVKAAMQGAVGQQVPPPPPLYPELQQSNVSLSFQGRCK